MYTSKLFPLLRTAIWREVQNNGLKSGTTALARQLNTNNVKVLTASAEKPASLFHQVRCYAKSKDIKKDKGKKGGAAKVEINETQLRETINLDAVNGQMQKAVDQMRDEFIKHLSLRSTTGSIDTLRVQVDGADHELQELAQISRKNPKTIVVNMISFPQAIPDVMKAIEKSGMNLNPQQDGTTLFIPIPKVTKEHRENLSKNAKTLFIKYRDAIRDVQNNAIKKLKKQSDISKDDIFAIQTQVTAIGDKFIAEADKILAAKQKELLGA